MSNSLDPDQALHFFVGPDLDLNCWQWLSAENRANKGLCPI